MNLYMTLCCMGYIWFCVGWWMKRRIEWESASERKKKIWFSLYLCWYFNLVIFVGCFTFTLLQAKQQSNTLNTHMSVFVLLLYFVGEKQMIHTSFCQLDYHYCYYTLAFLKFFVWYMTENKVLFWAFSVEYVFLKLRTSSYRDSACVCYTSLSVLWCDHCCHHVAVENLTKI